MEVELLLLFLYETFGELFAWTTALLFALYLMLLITNVLVNMFGREIDASQQL